MYRIRYKYLNFALSSSSPPPRGPSRVQRGERTPRGEVGSAAVCGTATALPAVIQLQTHAA